MVAFIVTGHANFGSSMIESMELITGEQSNFYAIDFVGSMNAKAYEMEMKILFDRLSEEYDHIIVLSDLLGGTPFKISAQIGVENDKVHVISGTNLGVLLDASLSDNESQDVKEIIARLIENGKEQLFYFDI